MKTQVHVVVTAEDIGNGNRCDPWNCPIARALWRATGAKWAVYGYHAYPIGKSSNCDVSLPHAAMDFVRDYDNLCYPEPMEFDIEVVSAESDGQVVCPSKGA